MEESMKIKVKQAQRTCIFIVYVGMKELVYRCINKKQTICLKIYCNDLDLMRYKTCTLVY